MIYLDEANGAVLIVSDFGNWSFCWPSHGRQSLKHFLAEIGEDYAYTKFASDSFECGISQRAQKALEERFHRFWVAFWPDFVDALKLQIAATPASS